MNRLLIGNFGRLCYQRVSWESHKAIYYSAIPLSRSIQYHTYKPWPSNKDYFGRSLRLPLEYGIENPRFFSTSNTYYEKEPLKPSSKVEATVEAFKISKALVNPDSTKPIKIEYKKPLKERIMDELRHYYHGFRLFFIEIRISTGLVLKILQGNSLTRREHRLLIATIGDLFRMVPFIIIILVPFLEFSLPFIIRFFPGMLPTTFETQDQKDQRNIHHLKVKLEIAKFFQETLDQMAPQSGNRQSELVKDFSDFFTRIRCTGEMAKSDEIIKFSKLFEDEITLDSLPRAHLLGLCRLLNVNTIGTNAMLRFSLRMKLRSLAADDKMISKEGVDSLTLNEVQQACRERGMRAYGVSEERLKAELKNWLNLSLNEKVPQSLLLLSRVLMLPEHVSTESKLQATISVLPEQILTSTKAAIGEKEGKLDYKTKVEAIKLEELKIKEEKKEMLEAEAEKKILETMKTEIFKDKAPIIDTANEPISIDPAPVIAIESTKPDQQGLSSKDIEIIEDAMENIAQKKKLLVIEKEHIQDLKEELSEYTEDVKELHEIVKTNNADIKLSKGATRLYRAVNSMIGKLDKKLGELESKEKDLKSTLQQASGEPQDTKEQLIHIDELMNTIKTLKKIPDEAKLKLIQDVLGRLDDDFDGQLKVDDVLKMVEIIGNEHVNLSERQMGELIELLDKEEMLEVENKIKKALDKAAESERHPDFKSDKSLFDLIKEAKEKKAKDNLGNSIAEKEKLVPKASDDSVIPRPKSQ